ncbi:MAG: hydroxyisourate hydrolase [Candidatus Acidiferrales bacterium]
MSEITTHVLDVSVGQPAAGVPVTLEIESAGNWKELSRGATDSDGRLRHLLVPGSLVNGTYRLSFETKAYFKSRKVKGLYPEVAIVFQVRNAKEHYHIPLLLSPFGYSTYRGS